MAVLEPTGKDQGIVRLAPEEEILEPELPIVDAHHHLMYGGGLRYLLDEFLADTGTGHDIRATIYCESRQMLKADGPEHLRPAGETEFANGIAAMSASGGFGPCRVNAGIISYADLRRPDLLDPLLDAHVTAGGGRFRGIRQIAIWSANAEVYRFISKNPPPPGVLRDPAFRQGLDILARRGFTYDVALFHPQLDELAAVAEAVPEGTIVLNHMGFALGLGCSAEERGVVFREWRDGMARLARNTGVVVKIGGLGMPFWGFGFHERPRKPGSAELAEAWRPYVEATIELFGAPRCMLESNFPPDGRSCSYAALWNALKIITRGLPPDDREALFSGTASRIYRLGTI